MKLLIALVIIFTSLYAQSDSDFCIYNPQNKNQTHCSELGEQYANCSRDLSSHYNLPTDKCSKLFNELINEYNKEFNTNSITYNFIDQVLNSKSIVLKSGALDAITKQLGLKTTVIDDHQKATLRFKNIIKKSQDYISLILAAGSLSSVHNNILDNRIALLEEISSSNLIPAKELKNLVITMALSFTYYSGGNKHESEKFYDLSGGYNIDGSIELASRLIDFKTQDLNESATYIILDRIKNLSDKQQVGLEYLIEKFTEQYNHKIFSSVYKARTIEAAKFIKSQKQSVAIYKNIFDELLNARFIYGQRNSFERLLASSLVENLNRSEVFEALFNKVKNMPLSNERYHERTLYYFFGFTQAISNSENALNSENEALDYIISYIRGLDIDYEPEPNFDEVMELHRLLLTSIVNARHEIKSYEQLLEKATFYKGAIPVINSMIQDPYRSTRYYNFNNVPLKTSGKLLASNFIPNQLAHELIEGIALAYIEGAVKISDLSNLFTVALSNPATGADNRDLFVTMTHIITSSNEVIKSGPKTLWTILKKYPFYDKRTTDRNHYNEDLKSLIMTAAFSSAAGTYITAGEALNFLELYLDTFNSQASLEAVINIMFEHSEASHIDILTRLASDKELSHQILYKINRAISNNTINIKGQEDQYINALILSKPFEYKMTAIANLIVNEEIDFANPDSIFEQLISSIDSHESAKQAARALVSYKYSLNKSYLYDQAINNYYSRYEALAIIGLAIASSNEPILGAFPMLSKITSHFYISNVQLVSLKKPIEESSQLNEDERELLLKRIKQRTSHQ